jgi:hypothetical protein
MLTVRIRSLRPSPSTQAGWAVGPNGRLAEFRLNPGPVKCDRPGR